MPGRVNTKLVVILVVLVGGVGILGIGGFTWFRLYYRNPTRLMNEGLQLAQNKEFDSALAQLRRAYKYASNDKQRIEALKEMAQTYAAWEAPNATLARDRFDRMLTCWQSILQIDPNHDQANKTVLESYYQIAASSGDASVWNLVHTQATNTLKSVPDYALAIRYRGIAQVSRMESQDLNEAECQVALDDLTAALKNTPDDAQVKLAIYRWHLAMARKFSDLGRAADSLTERNAAESLARQDVAQNPDNPESKLNLALVLRSLMRLSSTPRDQQLALLTEAGSLLTQAENMPQVREASDETLQRLAVTIEQTDLSIVDRPDGSQTIGGWQRAENLLKSFLDKHPDNNVIRLRLGQLLSKQGRWDDAIPILEPIVTDKPVPVDLQVIRYRTLQIAATEELADIYLAKGAQTEDNAEKAQWTAKAQAKLEVLRGFPGAVGLVNLLEGKLAFLNNDFQLAVTKLDKASDLLGSAKPESYLMSAQSYLILGEEGVATQRLEQYLQTSEGALKIPPRLTLAQLYLKQDNLTDAIRHLQALIDNLPQGNPQRDSAILLRAGASAKQAKSLLDSNPNNPQGQLILNEARKQIATIANQDDPNVVSALANLDLTEKNTEQARDRLLAYYKNHPDDFTIFDRILRLDMELNQKDLAIKRLQDAVTQFPDNAQLKYRLYDLTGDDAERDQQLLDTIQANFTGFEKDWRLFQFYSQRGDEQKAEQHYQAAKNAAPDDERILETDFQRAIAESNWTAARAIAERVAAMNDGRGLDNAHGRLWLGQLQLAQEDYSTALATLTQVVADLPSRSEAHRLLGDAYWGIENYTEAFHSYQNAIRLNPENAIAHQKLAAYYDKQGDHAKALAELKEIANKTASLRDAYLTYLSQWGDKAEALAARQRIAERVPENKANQRALARLLMQTRQMDAAYQLANTLFTADPANRDNVMLLAQYYAANNQVEKAIDWVRTYVNALGSRATVADWATFARFLALLGQDDMAVAAYEKAIAIENPDTRPASLALANFLFQRQKYDKASPHFLLYLQAVNFDNATLWRRYIETLINAEQIDEAAKQLKAYQARPEHKEEWQIAVLEANILFKQDRMSDAEQAYARAVNLAPTNPLVYLLRAQFFAQRGGDPISNQRQIESDLRRAKELDPILFEPRRLLAQLYIQRGDNISAIAELEQLLAIKPDLIPERINLIQLYARTNRLADAQRLLDESAKLFPDSPVWGQLRAQLQASAGNTDEALKGLAEAYQKAKTGETLLPYLNLLLASGNADESLKVIDGDWQSALNISPLLRAMRGRALVIKGSREEGLKDLNSAMNISTSDAEKRQLVVGQAQAALQGDDLIAFLTPWHQKEPSSNTARVLASVYYDQQKYDQAIDVLKQFHDDHPEDQPVLQQLASICQATQRNDECSLYYEKILKLNPDNLVALNNLAYLLAEHLNRPAEAVPLAERAVKLAGENAVLAANVLDTLGWVQCAAGQLGEAERTLRRSIEKQELVSNRFHLAKVLVQAKRPDEATQQLNLSRQLAIRNNDQDAVNEIDELLKSINPNQSNP